jgi:hypothetical protein
MFRISFLGTNCLVNPTSGGGGLNEGIIVFFGACMGFSFSSMCTIRLGCVMDIGACVWQMVVSEFPHTDLSLL